MQVKKQEVAEAIRSQLLAWGAKTQPAMVRLLKGKGLEISQPTLSRLLAGNYEGMPPSLTELCKYTEVSLNKYLHEPDPTSSPALMKALRDVWDGSPQREIFLAKVIKAAGKLGRT